MKQELQTKKDEIQDIGLDKIRSYFELNAEQLTDLDSDHLKHLYNTTYIFKMISLEYLYFILYRLLRTWTRAPMGSRVTFKLLHLTICSIRLPT